MHQHLGVTYAQVWADTQVIGALGSRTVTEALEAGEQPKTIWRAVHSHLDLPPRER
jgi:hypothetical protein